MRYDDWDVILFPTGRDSKIPFKEFKVACHVVPDIELAHLHGAVGSPVMTCFVPSLPPGTPFQVSIHCWRRPEISQFARTYSKNPDLVKFEARVTLDGRLVASAILDRDVNGPHLITSTFEFTKTGELERLTFPAFRQEILRQNHWHPGDDLGRIKVIISEGFPRDSLTVPIERVKNIVTFSFQHAPLEILENSGIAWPNPGMWRRPTPNPAVSVPTYFPGDGAESHAHSPGKRSLLLKGIRNHGFPSTVIPGSIFHHQSNPAGLLNPPGFKVPHFSASNPSVPNIFSPHDPFAEPTYRDWMSSITNVQAGDFWDGRTTWPINPRNFHKSDTIMADCPSQGGDPMQISGSSLEDDPLRLKAPQNTPTEGGEGPNPGAQFAHPIPSELTADLESALSQSLLNQAPTSAISQRNFPMPHSDGLSRKEGRQVSLGQGTSAQMPSTSSSMEARRLSQALFGMNNLPIEASVNNGVSASVTPLFAANQRSVNNPLVATFGSAILSQGSTNPSGTEQSTDTTATTTAAAAAAVTDVQVEPPAPTSNAANESVINLTSGTSSTSTVHANVPTSVSKRPRNFTPASARVIDEEDEPRRTSPQVQVGGFAETTSVEESIQ